MAGVYKKFPRELFRLNKGPKIRLREFKTRKGPLYDVVANDKGKIEPKALYPATYTGKTITARSYPTRRQSARV